MEKKKEIKFGLGLLIGSIVGALTALFVTPKTGKEMRELAKKWLEEELEKLKKEVGKIDKKKFRKAIDKVMEKVEREIKNDKKKIISIKRYLFSQMNKLRKKNKN